MVRGIAANSFHAIVRGRLDQITRRGGRRLEHDDDHRRGSSSQLQRPSDTPTTSSSSDPSLPLQLTSASQLALRVRSRSKVLINEDGSSRAVTKTQLRFRYDFESSDGQRLQLRAKARIKHSVTTGSDGEVAIKTRVKLQFSLLQQEVSDGVAPLLEGTPQDQNQPNPLQAFQGAVNAFVSDFADDGQIDADTLISSVLEEFNSLLDALSGRSSEPTNPLPELPVPREAVLDDAVIDDDSDDQNVVFALPTPDQSITLQPQEIDPVPTNDPTVIESENASDDDDAKVASQPVTDSPVPSEPASEETAVTVAAVPTVESPDAPAQATPEATAQEVLQAVRIRFVESFTQVIRTLSPSDDDGVGGTLLVQNSRLRFDARLQYATSQPAASSTEYLA